MTRTVEEADAEQPQAAVSPCGYRARLGDLEVTFATEADYRKAEKAMQEIRDGSDLPIPSCLTDRKTEAAKALAARLNRQRTVSLVRRGRLFYLVERPLAHETVLRSETGPSYCEARLKFGDCEHHPAPLLPLVLLLSYFGWDCADSYLSDRSTGEILCLAEDSQDAQDLASAVANLNPGRIACVCANTGQSHDFKLTLSTSARSLTTSAVTGLTQRLYVVLRTSLRRWSDEPIQS